LSAPSRRIEVSPLFADKLDKLKLDLNKALGVSLSTPEVTDILAHAQDAPRLDVLITKRSGKGGRKAEITPMDLFK